VTTALLAGCGLGFLVAAQVGPIWLLAARSVMLGRLITGIMIGLGAATIDVAYGALGLAGAASLLRLSGLRLGLGLLGAAVLIALGALALRTATRVRDRAEPPAAIGSAPRAYLTALGATAANPPTIASWAAVFAAASTARLTHTEAGKPLQFITLEDERGLSEVTIFAGTCRPLPYLTIGPYVATGAVEDRHGAVTLTARSVTRHAS